ncbi:MAG: glycosyltransferase [Gammaproteobacteria bacterium]|nr:glycosyltransferase [Gammaproteobacteria bacterium]
MTEKIKVLTISDHPLLPSGVGTQTKYFIEALINSGKFEVFSLGGAIKHPNYNLMTVNENWKILPVDGYGDKAKVLGIIEDYKPDALWFMTDPRYYEWLWSFEDDIRPNVPMIYYHVWDNYPIPLYNKRYYDSNDVIATISKLTSDIVQKTSPDVEETYLPHAVPMDTFRKATPLEMSAIYAQNPELENKIVFFWNNRNAKRKQSGTLIYWFSDFINQEEIDRDKVCLLMHTDPEDPHGQPLEYLATSCGLINREVIFSKAKMTTEELAKLYSLASCTINIADAEGFGLATLESLSCETPIIVTMTGGLQEQVTDGENWFGIGIEPESKSVIGSQMVPYIYEDRISKESFLKAMNKIYHMTEDERNELGKAGREHVLKNYNFEDYGKRWIKVMEDLHEKYGSWENRKEYKSWRVTEL